MSYIKKNNIYHMDCLEGMKLIPDQSIDFILCDLPYGITDHEWDEIIPFPLLWEQYERLIKPEGAIALTATESFTNKVIQSNPSLYKYKWIWMKNRYGHFVNAKNRPMSAFEEVLIFSKASIANRSKLKMNYFPQGLVRKQKPTIYRERESQFGTLNRNYRSLEEPEQYTNYPNNILNIPYEEGLHPTQKPVALFKYLIKTYTQEGMTVLDNCMGSGTTAIACLDSNRFFIGFEKDTHFFEVCQKRITENTTQMELL